MPRAQAGTPKAIANAMKAKGLGRLRWYCQVCEKQCRDENGFKMHTQTESHLRKMLLVGEHAGKHIDEFSKNFMDEFIQLLSRRHSTQRVRANAVYNEYIQDKHHVHMNSTKWVTLSEFVKFMGREGIVRVDEDDKGWWISWVDNSPKALARQAELQKRERSDMDDEQRQRRHLKEQIARAAAQAEARAAATAEGGIGGVEEGLKRDEGEGVRLSLNLSTNTGPIGEVGKKDQDEAEVKKEEGIMEAGPSTIGPTPTTTTTAQPAKFSFSTGLKKPQPGLNVFKQASKAPKRPREVEEDDETTKLTTNLAQKKFLTAAEKLMLEDQERKKRGGGGGSRGMGYMGMGPQRGGR